MKTLFIVVALAGILLASIGSMPPSHKCAFIAKHCTEKAHFYSEEWLAERISWACDNGQTLTTSLTECGACKFAR
jgi:hypothetical protein